MMNQQRPSKRRPAIRPVTVVTLTATVVGLCALNAGCSLQGKKGSFWPQASADANASAASSEGMAVQTPAKAEGRARVREQNERVALVSFDRSAGEDTALPWLRSQTEPVAGAIAAHASGQAAAGGERVSADGPPPPEVPAKGTNVGVVSEATSDTFDELVLNSDVPVLVDFSADWCGPCRALAPKLHELAREVPDLRVVKVDVDESPDIAARYQVGPIPALRVFERGEVTARHVGLASKERLKALVGR
jgi:thioredoxin 1